jgi:predicted  nucleic acid-binding Zn-ribbon protein
MKKMYAKKPTDHAEDKLDSATKNGTDEKQIKALEENVRRLNEQVAKLTAAQQLSSRQIRRQNTDINNVTTALRNK